MQRYMGYILILVAALGWGMVGPLCLYCIKAGMTPVEIAFWRTLIGGCLLCAHAACTGSLRLQSGRDGIVLFIFGSLCIAGMFSSFQSAVQQGGAALAVILMYTAPVWVAVASHIIFKEVLTGAKLLAIGVSLGGVACISLSGSTGVEAVTPLAVFLGLASGLLYSGHYIFSKFFLNRYSPFTLYGISMLSASLVCLPFVDINIQRVLSAWLPLLFLCVVCSYVSYWTYSEGLKRVEPTRAVILASIDPMVGILAAWLWWDEFFSPTGWIGTALILVAVFLIIMDGSRSPTRTGEHGREQV